MYPHNNSDSQHIGIQYGGYFDVHGNKYCFQIKFSLHPLYKIFAFGMAGAVFSVDPQNNILTSFIGHPFHLQKGTLFLKGGSCRVLC